MATEDGPAGGGGGNKDGPPPPRKKSKRRQRQKQFKIPCTPDEFNAIAAKANDAGMTRAAWSRDRRTGGRRPPFAAPSSRPTPRPSAKFWGISAASGTTLTRSPTSSIPEAPPTSRSFALP